MKKSVIIFSVLTVLTVVFIFSNSLLSGTASGGESGKITRFILSIIDPNGKIPFEEFHYFIRKAAHFSEFFLLGTELTLLCFALKQKRLFLLPTFASLFVAVIDEFIQSFTGRTSSVSDVLLDFSGALTAMLIISIIVYIITRYKKTKQ